MTTFSILILGCSGMVSSPQVQVPFSPGDKVVKTSGHVWDDPKSDRELGTWCKSATAYEVVEIKGEWAKMRTAIWSAKGTTYYGPYWQKLSTKDRWFICPKYKL